ncbi:MAG TPA: O-antigen ligase family protein [Opitutus sp.]|nr:O-antigen ligase family protein [Opitutus sp.]
MPVADRHRSALFADSLRTVAGVVLLTALGVAPLNYGSTRPVPFETLIALVATGGFAWLAACAFARRWPLPPPAMQIGILLVAAVALAWLLFLPEPALPPFTRHHYARVADRWPYSVVPRSQPLLIGWAVSGIIALLALWDLAREAAWRRIIAGVMIVTGAGVAALGLLQNATHAAGIYWDHSQRLPGAFFATFFHHTAAGAYLNSVWPLGFALALLLIRDGRHRPRKQVAIYGALGCSALILVAHAGHVSRLPQVLAIVTLAAFSLWIGLWAALARVPHLRIGLGLLAVALVAAAFKFGGTRIGEIRGRWHQIVWANLAGGGAVATSPPESAWPRLMRDDLFVPSDHRPYFLGDRGAAYAAALAAISAQPWFGWGPGGWTAAAAAHSHDAFTRTFYLMLQFTHEDYLQTVVEWGLLGALGWALLVPGGLIRAVLRLRLHPARDFIGAGAVAALVAVLAQSLIDFPLQLPSLQLNAIALAALAWSVPAVATAAQPTPLPFHERA